MTYLSLDGIDDKLVSASVTYTEIIIDFLPNETSFWDHYVDPRTTSNSADSFGYLYRNSYDPGNKAVWWDGYTQIYYNGVLQTKGTNFIVQGQRATVRLVRSTAQTTSITFFAKFLNDDYTKGNIYSIKILNGANVQADYDFNKGTVLDQSGNGKHAVLTGGAWIQETAPIPPIATIISTSKQKISKISGIDRSITKFKFNVNVTQWEVRVGGIGQGTGFLADSGSAAVVNVELSAEIDWSELALEGVNKINIYGKSIEGIWTVYE